MGSMLDIGSMRERIAAALSFEQSVLKSGIRAEALTPLHYLFTGQMELPRSMFKQLTGLGERVATSLLSALLGGGYLASDTPYPNGAGASAAPVQPGPPEAELE